MPTESEMYHAKQKGLADYEEKKEEEKYPNDVAWEMEETVNPAGTREYYEQKRYLLLQNLEITEEMKSLANGLSGEELFIRLITN